MMAALSLAVMQVNEIIALPVLIVALLYASIGHAGATGYLAVMALAGIDPAVARPNALLLNVIVAAIASVQFARAAHFRFELLKPLVITSIPCALLGGAIDLPASLFSVLLGAALLASAVRIGYGAYQTTNPAKQSGQPSIAAASTTTVCSAAVEEKRLRQGADEQPLRTSTGRLLALGGTIGLLSGLTGIGGGVFLTPALLAMHAAPPKTVAAVTAPFILVNSIAGLSGKYAAGRGIPALNPTLVAAVVIGGLIGSQCGAFHFSHRLFCSLIACVLALASIRLLGQPLGW